MIDELLQQVESHFFIKKSGYRLFVIDRIIGYGNNSYLKKNLSTKTIRQGKKKEKKRRIKNPQKKVDVALKNLRKH